MYNIFLNKKIPRLSSYIIMYQTCNNQLREYIVLYILCNIWESVNITYTKFIVSQDNTV